MERMVFNKQNTPCHLTVHSRFTLHTEIANYFHKNLHQTIRAGQVTYTSSDSAFIFSFSVSTGNGYVLRRLIVVVKASPDSREEKKNNKKIK